MLSGGIAPTLWGSIRWNWESFGVLALLGIVGLALLPRERLHLQLHPPKSDEPERIADGEQGFPYDRRPG